MKSYESWGRCFSHFQHSTHSLQWHSDTLPQKSPSSLLPYGLGRSYGDSCLNEGGFLIETRALNHFLDFQPATGVLRTEAGVSLTEILDFAVPQGFFLPTTPGTKFVTLGGAIANDIHGKNHHHSGSFGCHVRCFELLRSDGQRLFCSPTENKDWFCATIGGLGLTGVLTWAEIQLIPIPSPYLAVETIKFHTLKDFFNLSQESEKHFEYSVAWIDSLAQGRNLGRGHFIRGNFTALEKTQAPPKPLKAALSIPCNAPHFLLNAWSIRCFNLFYFHRQREKIKQGLQHYEPFFYPLDILHQWNRIYGKRGFFQYQSVIPLSVAYEATLKMLREISQTRLGSFLMVLKTFGNRISPGLLSFPRPGVTLALDFPNHGEPLFTLFRKLDDLVSDYQGVLYPAKDARMSATHFQKFYPQWTQLLPYLDPQFSSSFWRRVVLPSDL
jgi:FAD/FMN-containing dehydrogenase